MIAVVEDEKELCESLKMLLTEKGYEIVTARSCGEADKFIGNPQIDMFLLDVKLPDGSGFDICRKIRKSSEVPVIFLTSCDNEEEIVTGLDIGADDYITKPFEIREVLARIQVQLRHIEAETKSEAEAETEAETEVIIKDGIQEGQGSGRLEFRDMVLTRSTFEVSIGGRVLPKITKQEFAILELLLKNPKQVFSKEDIFEYAWDEPYMGETKTLDVHISNIRKKIKTVTPDEYIETIWGIGYRLHE